MIVKYKSKKYKCSCLTAIKVKFQIIRLCIRRGLRRIGLVFLKRDFVLYVGIIIAWIIYAFVTYFLSGVLFNDNAKDFFIYFWELKSSIFTSVVLAFSIGAYNHLIERRRKLKRQHWEYVNAMEEFEHLLDLECNIKTRHMYHFFYNDRCFDITTKKWKDAINTGDYADMSIDSDVLLNRLNDIKLVELFAEEVEE